jgi:cobalt-zinc-cadmium efflux system outer membrane protein
MRILFFILFAAFIPSPCHAMTLEEAVDFALKNNPDIQKLRLEESSAEGRKEKAALLFAANPTLEGNIFRRYGTPEEGRGNFTNYDVKLSHEWEIAGQRGIRIDIAEKELAQVRLEIIDRERVLISEVKDTFAKTLSIKMRKGLARDVVKLQQELLDFTEVKFRAGEAAGLDVNLAEVELSKSKKELLTAEREYRDSLLALQEVMGMKTDIALEIGGELPEEATVPPDKEGLRKLALAQRPDAKASSIEAEKTMAAFTLVRREIIPNVTISGFYGRDDGRNEAGVGLSIPLPLFDRKQAELSDARAKASQATIKEDALQKTVERDFEQAYAALTLSMEELAIYKKDVIAKAYENLLLLNFAYKEGKLGFFSVRLAQKEIVDTQFGYLELRLKTQLALNALERAVGGTLK